MRNAVVQLCLLLIAITSVHAVKLMQSSSLQGKVFPAEAAEKVWAIRGRDSVNIRSSEGDFYLTLSPGHWRVVVDAKAPYKDVFFKEVDVKRGATVDLGKIRLEKEL